MIGNFPAPAGEESHGQANATGDQQDHPDQQHAFTHGASVFTGYAGESALQ
ncbi:MAG: hypothetical protein ACD_10C00727G0004 [uncultured bacterium]|nr:MAG: hypothetical protein ACD_10C00727G0004 [uncultured bacterium]